MQASVLQEMQLRLKIDSLMAYGLSELKSQAQKNS